MNKMLETYRGEALAWEADDLGHMNMRYYFARAAQGRMFLMGQLQLPGAFKANALSTVIPRNQHIKYIAELRPGQGMFITSGILELGECHMRLLHLIWHTEGKLSASFIETVSHISRRTQKPFAWSSTVRAAAQNYMCEMVDGAAPRNIDLGATLPWPQDGSDAAAKAEEIGLQNVGRGVFGPAEADIFGYVRPVDLLGRVSDCVQHFTKAWPDMAFHTDDKNAGDQSGALLEAYVQHINRPQPGDSFLVRSGLRGANANTRELVHWIMDPVSGQLWSGLIGVSCRFDLKARRLIKTDEKALKLLQDNICKGL